MKGNSWLIGYLVFTALLLGGAGFYFSQGWGAYSEAFSGWDAMASKIERLEREEPYPDEENEAALAGLVEGYEAEVSALYESLDRYQRPLAESLSDSEFTTQVLSGKVTEFLRFATQNNTEVEKRDEFYMAMNAYQSTFPRPAMVPMLTYQLEAIDHLLRQAVESGVERIRFVTREQLPGESSAAADGADGIVPGQVVQKYPINLRFIGSHPALEEFVNRVGNDKEFFFILRVLRVDNSSPGGPALLAGDAGPTFKNAGGEIATRAMMEERGLATLSFDEFLNEMTAAGWELQREDARIIFGQETLEVFAVVDLVRFLPPDQVAPPEEEPAGGPRRRARP